MLGVLEAHGIVSVATPAISTGVFGYPLDEAADVALGTLVRAAPYLRYVRHVRFVLWGEAALQSHAQALVRRTADLP